MQSHINWGAHDRHKPSSTKYLGQTQNFLIHRAMTRMTAHQVPYDWAWDQRPATSRRCGSSKQLAHPDRAVAGGTCRPGHRDCRRSTSQLDANVWGLSRWRRCLCRQADRHEDGLGLLRLGPIHDVCAHDIASWLQLCLVHPPTQQVGVDAVGHCHCGHRHARLRAGRQCIGLEIVTVHATPPATAGLLIGDSVHVSTKS